MSDNYKIANYYGLNYKIYDDGTIVGPKRGIVKQRKNSDGYMECTLGSLENRHARVKVHRIIAEQFVPNPLNLPEVNHIDYDRKNNNANNLEWITHQDNIKHSAKVGHYKNSKTGENNGRAKITWDIANSIRELYGDGHSIAEIARKYDLNDGLVGNVVHNRTWKI